MIFFFFLFFFVAFPALRKRENVNEKFFLNKHVEKYAIGFFMAAEQSKIYTCTTSLKQFNYFFFGEMNKRTNNKTKCYSTLNCCTTPSGYEEVFTVVKYMFWVKEAI